MKAILVAATMSAFAIAAATAHAESCVDAFNAIANPQNFPGRVQSVIWSNASLSKTSPLIIGNWTVSFPRANSYPIARFTSAGYFAPVTGSVRKSYVYIDGLTCANAVSGAEECTLVMAKTDVLNTGVSQDQDYFELGTPSQAENGDLSTVGVRFIAWAGCPSDIGYVH